MLNSELDCVINNTHQLIVPIETHYQYPECKRENITVVHATEGSYVMCLEKMLGKNNAVRDSAKLVGLSCTNEYEDIFDVPPVISIKKCCPPERKYNNYTTGCWDSNIKNDSKTIDKLLKALLNNTPNYIDITFGAPICKNNEMLVDYQIPYKQVRQLDSEAILMRIPGYTETIILPPESICVDMYGYDDLTLIIRFCQDEILTCKFQKKPCIRKCCPDGQSLFRTISKTCKPSKSIFNPKFYSNVKSKNRKIINDIRPSLTYGQKCKSVYLLEPSIYEDDITYLDTNGDLYSPSFNNFINKENYCIEWLTLTELNKSELSTFMCFPNVVEQVVKSSNLTNSFFIATATGNMVSCFFLLLTFIVYLCLPNLHGNIHGKTVMCYIVSLIATYICLSFNQLGSIFHILVKENNCRAVGK